MHASIDEALLGPLEFLTAAGYRRFLSVLYGFQAPLEAALVMTPGIDLEFVEDRQKAGRIANDLLNLGLTRREFSVLARRQTIGPFDGAPDALGFMYSTERLMLHLEAMRVRFECEMPVVYTLANQFLCSYQNLAETRWRQYGVMLDRIARANDVDRIVASARAGIESLQHWLVDSGASIESEQTAHTRLIA